MKICSVCHRCYKDREVECAEKSHNALLELYDGDIEMIAGYLLGSLHYSDARERVFKARHIQSDRSCIIRLIRTHTDRVKDFLLDAKIATSLFHPNVVDTYETGQLENGDLFAVTEDAAGQTLREMMSDGTPDLMTAIRIATEAASAVHTIHLKSLVHRAIRPENIVIARDDSGGLLVRIKDPDLGGVAERSIVSDKFTIDSARCQLRYFAPEQCNAEPVGIKTDVYSLGIVLYEMLAGRPPFDSPKASGLIEMHRHRRPAEISIDDFELRMLVTHTLMQSLSKHPSDRQSSANAFARQLRHVEQLATHVSTPPPAGVIPPEPARSSPRIHISEAGPPKDIIFAANPVEPVFADDTATLFVRENETEDVTVSATEMLPAAHTAADDVPAPRQWFSRLKLQKKVSHFESISPENVSDLKKPESKSALEPQTFCLETTAEKILKIGRHPVKVDWEQPEDDLPSMEAVVAARTEVSTQPEKLNSAKVVEPPRVEAPPTPAELPKPTPVLVAAAAASTRVGASTLFATAHHEPDEITAPPRRGNPIRIDIPAPRPRSKREPIRNIAPSPADESSYFPTLLGAKPEPSSGVAPASILSSFYSDAPPRSVLPVQKTALAMGVVAAAAAIFALGNASAWKHFSSPPVDDRVSASASSPDSVQQQGAVTAPQSVSTKKPLKYFDSPKPNANTPGDPKSDAARSKGNKNKPESGSKTDKKNTTQGASAERSKTSTKPETGKRGKTDRSMAASATKPTATTRPRIVKVSRP